MKGRLFRAANLNWVGAAILAGGYLFSLLHVLHLRGEEHRSDVVTIRIAHWSLEVGTRDAMDALGAAYTKLHPNVRIEQIAIPDKVYTSWLVSQLLGGTAPDLIALNANITNEYYARYFLPLTEAVAAPNPYNAGTPLEGKRWRDTFLDGLGAAFAYNNALMEVYGVGPGINTIRLYYNKDLYAKAMGAAPGAEVPPPASYRQLLDACERLEAYSRTSGRPLVAIAGSTFNGPLLMNLLFSSQTQRPFAPSLEDVFLTSTGPWSNAYEIGMAYLRGEWNLETPAIARGISIMHDVSRHMQPGFMQVQREDATFYFLQQRAAMIVTGSWDAKGLLSQATFPIGVCEIPLPGSDDPQYGASALGKLSESPATGAMGVARGSAHPEVAIDFLRFLTSQRGVAMACRISGLLPSVEGVEPPSSVKAFAPNLDGYPGGMTLDQGIEMKRVFNSQFYLVAGQEEASVSSFAHGLEEAGYRDAILSDMRHGHHLRRQLVQRNDVTFAALLNLRRDDPAAERKFVELGRRQNDAEAQNYRLEGDLKALGIPLQP